jgi:inhibitor of KinA
MNSTKSDFSYRIFPLGDSALTINFGNIIDENINKKITSLFKAIQQKPLKGMIEAIPAYSSLSILYDVVVLRKIIPSNKTVYDWMKDEAVKFLQQQVDADNSSSDVFKIPVCYDEEFALDLERFEKEKNISKEELIKIHTGKQYRVYMLGFLPGFPYMGEVDERISMPRKPQPQQVAAGSIGIAGRQTGIYPLTSPGGWSIIGRTPIKIFDAEKEELTFLKAGNIVQFYPISKEEFLKFEHEPYY